jgi:hypothetical protein
MFQKQIEPVDISNLKKLREVRKQYYQRSSVVWASRQA